MSGIVVGVDGSGPSQETLEWAAREAALRQVPLTVVTVHQPLAGYWGGVEYPLSHALVESDLRAAREQADKILGRLGGEAPTQIVIDVASGSSADDLLAAAKDADLLVVGARGSGGFAQLFLASARSPGAGRPRCPVVLVPSGDR